MRVILLSIAASGTLPLRTAATSLSPQGPSGPGMTRSSPDSALGTVVVVADQSETTTPLNPQSDLSTSCSIELVVMVAP